jgi:cyclophilin family peptidyl-prolyl cis-trans isomerase
MKKVALFSTVLVATFVLAGCTGPEPQDSTLKFSNGASANGQTQSQAQAQPPADASSQNYQLQNNQVQPPQTEGPKMKTLADFTPIEATSVTLLTTKGDVTFELYRDKAPLTTLNFLSLAKAGFYNDITFHRVIADFMAQVGDPLTKDPNKESMWGTGGPGYAIADEFDPSLKFDSEGIVAMANSGPGTGGSQFFITYEATPWLDGKHTIFGKVTEGMDVVRNIVVGDKIISITFK